MRLLRDHPDSGRISFNARERNCLFVNGRGRRFVEAGYPLGVDVDLEGRGVAVGDLDQDGAQDLVVRSVARQKLAYFHNEVGARAHFLRVDLVGTRSNRDALGAVARVVAGGLRQMRVKMAGSGFQGQSEGTLHFGLGEAARVEELTIRWPSGRMEVFRDLEADQIVRVVEGEGRFTARRPAGWRAPASVAAAAQPWQAWTLGGETWRGSPGKPALVALWASWCKACAGEVAALNELHARRPGGLEVVGIAFDEVDSAAVSRFVERTSPAYPIALATRESLAPLLERAFGEGAVPMPAAVLLDGRGAVVRALSGKVGVAAIEREVAGLARGAR